MSLDRRQFLSGLAAATVSSNLAGPALAKTPANQMPLGLQLYTLRSELAKDFEGTLAKVAELGYKEVEFFNLLGNSAKDARDMLDRHGLIAPSTHTLLKPLRDDLDQLIEDCHTLGHNYLTLAFLMPNERKTLDQYRQHAETLQAASERCSKAGIQLAYHNHDFEFLPIEGTLPYDLLLEATSARTLVMELDLYWIAKVGIEPLTYLAKDPMRFQMVHVKDMDATEDQAFTEVGTGVIDFKSIFASPHSRGIRHLYVEQDVIVGDHWNSVTTSLAGLKQALG